MGILDKLKKEKKKESVLDSLLKKQEDEKKSKDIPKKPDDIEVRELPASDTDKLAMAEDIDMQPVEGETRPAQEFRAEGMHEFTLDSLGADSGGANLKAEYKSKVVQLIDKGKIDEAIKLLEELQLKLIAEG
jgi:hypothetical protein